MPAPASSPEPLLPRRSPAGADRGRLFGRAREEAEVEALFARGARLVTLTGPAGAGKSCLARRLAARAADATWAFHCDVSAARDRQALLACVAWSLDLPPATTPDERDEVARVGRALDARPAPLLVLDGLDHLLPEAAATLRAWLVGAPAARILVTARALTHLPEEHVVELGPLPEATELFLHRARQVRPGYATGADDAAIVARIVELLDGLPLAVELAAARARVLAPAKLLAAVSARASGAVSGRRDPLDDAVAWSWELLDARDRAALATLAVFGGAFAVDDARALLEAAGVARGEATLDALQSLRDRSLLHEHEAGPGGEARLATYRIVREHARRRLAELGLAAGARAAHARHFVERGEGLLARAAPDELQTVVRALAHDAGELEAIAEDGCEGDDVARSLAARAIVLLGAIAGEDGLPPRQAALADRAIARAPAALGEAALDAARVVRATSRVYAGQPAAAAEECREIAARAAARGDERAVAAATLTLGTALLRHGDAAAALEMLRDAERIADRAGDVATAQIAICQQGGSAHALHRPEEALARFERGLDVARARGLVRGRLRAEIGLASYHLEAGHDEAAREHLARAGELARAAGARRTSLLVGGHLGILHLDHGRFDDAAESLSAAATEAREIGDEVPFAVFLAAEAAARAALGDADGAAPLAARAARVLPPGSPFAAVVDVYAARVDVALALASPAASSATAWADSARARVERAEVATWGAGKLVDQSDDLRVALRVARRGLDAWAARAAAPAVVAPAERVITVARDGTWFQLDGERPVDLSRRGSARGILCALLAPETRASVDALVAAGWPGEKMAWSSALNRLHVALATLRTLGLRDVLARERDGYVLRARVRVADGPRG